MASRPPLTAIFVFCTAARTGSFKLAAEELCVTPGAVSRQILALESHLGLALFERGTRAVKLTAQGRQLRDRVAGNMAAIGAEVELMRGGGRKKILRVDTGVTLAMHWLIPRLADFKRAHPDIDVRISTSDGPIDPGRGADVYIRRDPGELLGLAATVFLDEHSVLAAGARLPPRKKRFTARGMKSSARIGALSRPDLWRQWSAHHQLAAADFEPTLTFDNTVLALQAAVEGLGAMVVPDLFIGGLLDGGMLVLLDPSRVPTGTYAYATRARHASASTRRFTTWLDGFAAIAPRATPYNSRLPLQP